MTRKLLVLVLAVSALLVPTNASGVWGGVLDTAHPQVGSDVLRLRRTGVPRVDGLVCSGSYAGDSKRRPERRLPACGPLPAARGARHSAAPVRVVQNNASVTDIHSRSPNAIQVQSYHQMPGFGHDLGDLRDLGILLLPKDSVAGRHHAGAASAGGVPRHA